MARIRSIKPEITASESFGRISRNARLLFILLWTIADDEGRSRGASRFLASTLYPYDDDAHDHIDEWLTELEREGCVIRYKVDGSTYLQLCNWLKHQKIDKPSASKIPAFSEASREVARPREASSLDMDLGIGPMDQGSGKGTDRDATAAPPAAPPMDKQRREPDPANVAVWASYSDAFQARYGVEPQRNQVVNSQIAAFVKRVGRADAAEIAAWYVGHSGAYYVGRMHPVSAMLSDAEKLASEWRSGRRITSGVARSADRSATNADVAASLIHEVRSGKL